MTKKDVAPKGMLWVCMACGKTSPKRYGGHPDTMHMWDESCFMNAGLFRIEDLERNLSGRVTKITGPNFDPDG